MDSLTFKITDAFVVIVGAVGGILGLVIGYLTAATPLFEVGTFWELFRSLIWIAKCFLFFGSLFSVCALLPGAVVNNLYLRLRGYEEITFPEVLIFWIGLVLATVFFDAAMILTEVLDKDILAVNVQVSLWLGIGTSYVWLMYLVVQIVAPIISGLIGLIVGVGLFSCFSKLKQ